MPTATPRPGAPIHIDVEDGDQVTLRVRDEGPGISDEVAGRLFRDRVTAGRGLGLGLYLVHASMQAMGGSVQLEQRRPDCRPSRCDGRRRRPVSPRPGAAPAAPGPVAGYPLEPSNEELAAIAGLPARGDRALRHEHPRRRAAPRACARRGGSWDPAAVVEYGDLGYRRLRAAIGAHAGRCATARHPGLRRR